MESQPIEGKFWTRLICGVIGFLLAAIFLEDFILSLIKNRNSTVSDLILWPIYICAHVGIRGAWPSLDKNRQSTGGNAWIVVLTVICIGRVAGPALSPFDPRLDFNKVPHGLAVLAGICLVATIQPWLAFCTSFLLKRDIRLSAIAYAALSASAFVGIGIIAPRQSPQREEAASASQQAPSRIASPEGALDANTRAGGPNRSLGQVDVFFRDLLDHKVASLDDYLQEQEAFGWSSVLDAQRIARDRGLSESTKMIEKAKALVDTYEKKEADFLKRVPARIEAHELDEPSKKFVLDAWGARKSRIGRGLATLWQMERQVLRQYESIFKVLGSSGEWGVEGDQILLFRDNERTRFETCSRTAQKVKRQMELFRERELAKLYLNPNPQEIGSSPGTEVKMKGAEEDGGRK